MTLYQFLILNAVLIDIWLAIYAYRMRKSQNALVFSLLMLFLTVYSIGSFFALTSENTVTALVWRNIYLIGFLLAIPTTLILVLGYTGKENLLKPVNIVLIYALPAAGLVLRWTDRFHHLMRKEIIFEKGHLVIISTPLGEAVIFMERSIAFAAVVLLILFYGKVNLQFRKQVFCMAAGIAIPLAFETVRSFNPYLEGILPPTSVLLTLTGIIAFWGIFRYKLFSLLPIARDKILGSISEGIIIADDQGRIVDKNEAIDRFIGDITGKGLDILGRNIAELASSYPRWFSACSEMNADEFEVDSSAWGKKRYYRVKVCPLLWKNSKKRGSLSIVFDITETKSREEELLSTYEVSREQLGELAIKLDHKNKQLESIIENMSDHCLVVDKTGSYVLVNKSAKELFSSVKVKRVGDYLKSARYYDGDGNEILAGSVPANRVMNGEKLTNYRLLLKNDEVEKYFDVNGTPVYDDNGEFLFGVICSHDITNVVLRKKEIMMKNEQLETIINTMSDMAILSITDKEGNFLYYSKSADNYFSAGTFQRKAGASYRKGVYFHEDGTDIEFHDMPAMRVLRGEKVTNFHYLMRSEKGEFHFLVNGTPIYDENGNLTNGVFFNIDITEQVLHQRMAPILEQLGVLNAFKDKLFTIMTHDLRDPLAAMVNLTEILEGESAHYSSDIVEMIESVKEHVSSTFETVEHMLEWFKGQKSGLLFNPSHFALLHTTGEVVKAFQFKADQKEIKITVDIAEDAAAYADKEMFRLVLRNILSNAVKFTGRGGSIKINAFKSGDRISVSVADTGVGISPEKIQAILSGNKLLAADAGEKSGIGLLICKEFVHRNGGDIWIHSTPGEGSAVCFTLPAGAIS